MKFQEIFEREELWIELPSVILSSITVITTIITICLLCMRVKKRNVTRYTYESDNSIIIEE